MAIHTTSTPPRLSEAAASVPDTALSSQFTAMMQCLSAYLDAVSGADQGDCRDLARDAHIAAADQSRSEALDSLALLLATPVVRPEDLPLRHCAIVARLLVRDENAADVQKAINLPRQKARLFRACGNRLIADQVNAMIDTFLPKMKALAALSAFSDAGEMAAVAA